MIQTKNLTKYYGDLAALLDLNLNIKAGDIFGFIGPNGAGNTTTMRPKESIQVCIEEKVPLFCAGLGNPGFMVADAHAAGMKVLGITGNTKNARRMTESGMDLLVAQGCEDGR